ncbi:MULTISPECIES: hypothetical protein [unclassified Nonlabens]|uniref:hypothetical protein n=1 Tax=unclassified Nonlabens TaxID=2615035 RepID=UPI001428BA5E|nr:hypothetical protein [Nonlabens sp. SY33080]
MAGSKFIRGNKQQTRAKQVRRAILLREKALLKQHFDFLKCKISSDLLIVKGYSKPTVDSIFYSYTLTYNGISSPKVLIDSPTIEYNDDIHMFPKDNSLCLYHSETDNLKWDFRKHHLYDTIIPWTQEWFIYYELYNITGKWEHPHIDHRLTNIKSIEVNI